MNNQTFPIWLTLTTAFVLFTVNEVQLGLIPLGIAIGLTIKGVIEEWIIGKS